VLVLALHCVCSDCSGFKRRGGETDKHEHGWGIAIYEGRGLRMFLDTLPASISPVAELVERYPMKTLNMMAHIRYATQGAVSLENVHPYQREMWGINWCFTHNGDVPKFSNFDSCQNPLLGLTGSIENCTYHPVGDTDSEAVFCAILNALKAEFHTLPTLPLLYQTLQRLCAEIVSGEESQSIVNFLLGCGQYTLFAYSWPGARPGSSVWNGLYYTIRKPPFSTAKLADIDYSVDFSKLTNENDRVAVIATKPLTVDEHWKEFKRGQLLMFDNGLPYSELYDCDEVEQQGRGLCSRVIQKAPQQALKCPNYDTPTMLRHLVDDFVDSTSFSYPSKETKTDDKFWANNGADLGCGTGRSGLAFRSFVQNMTGVDLSSEMIDKARARGCYDQLVVGNVDCIQHEAQQRGSLFDIVIACDVLVYIDDLKPVFQSVRSSLVSKYGLFVFSAEFIEDDEVTDNNQQPSPPFVLQSCARFAHKRNYIETLVTDFGFEIKSIRGSKLRKQGGKDVESVHALLQLVE